MLRLGTLPASKVLGQWLAQIDAWQIGVAAHGLAVGAQDLVLAGDPLRRAEHVARIGVLGHQPQRLPLAATIACPGAGLAV